MSTSTPIADWVTRDQLAQLAGCSVDTIRRDVAKHQLHTTTDAAGRTLVKAGDFVAIGRVTQAALNRADTPAEAAALVRGREVEARLREQVARLEGRLVEIETTVATLREQLSVKDRQLGKNLEQVSQLTALVSRLTATGGAA